VTVAVVFPWRAGQPERERHYKYVTDTLHALLPDAFHIDADSAATPFSRAGSRNLGVDVAISLKADIVVLVDADTIPEAEPLYAAIEGAKDGRLHLPYTKYRGLSRQGTVDYLNGTPPDQCRTDMETDWSTGGIMILQPEAWKRASGMDERIVGYSFEDTIFRICADAILGPTVRHEGTISHLWHPSAYDPTDANYLANRELAHRFDEAEGDRDAVVALIAERE
jgi:hypothetical protein